MARERLIARGDEALLCNLRPELERASRTGAKERGARDLAGRRVFFKLGPLRGKVRLRHGLRRLLGRGLPRLREFENLTWLRASGFGAPEPLLAGAFLRKGLPVFQFLFTAAVARARTVREALESGPPAERAPLLEALAGDVARLHVRGFVHRDLFPRNLLVTTDGGTPRIHFLDAWRGGARRGLRGADYDLGCFFLYAADLLSSEEARRKNRQIGSTF